MARNPLQWLVFLAALTVGTTVGAVLGSLIAIWLVTR